MSGEDFYGGEDPRHLPLYGLAEAARYLRLAPATLRSWTRGRSYPRRGGQGFFAPLIQPASPGGRMGLSFSNLIEAHVLRALRTRHAVSIRSVRMALDYAESQLGIERLLTRRTDLLSNGGDLFLTKYGELINLSRSGQLAMRGVLERHLKRIEWDPSGIPVRLFPFVAAAVPNEQQTIALDPYISFGRPIVLQKGIRTAIIAGRVDAGETIEDLARDYDLHTEEIELALLYESAA